MNFISIFKKNYKDRNHISDLPGADGREKGQTAENHKVICGDDRNFPYLNCGGGYTHSGPNL